MQRFILALTAMAAIASLLIVTGCGQSGPLYLPGNPSRIETVPPAPTGPASTELEQQDEKEKNDTSSK